MNHQAIILAAVVCLLSMTSINCLPTRTHCSGKAANLFFVLDSSSSIWSVDYEKQLEFVEELVEPFDIGPADSQVHVGAITFSNHAHLEFSLDEYTDKDQLKKAIAIIPYRQGQTNTAEALDLLHNEIRPRLGKTSSPFIAVIITDGMSSDTKATRREAAKLHKDGVSVFAIGVGHQFDLSELKAIASDPDNNVYQVSSYSALENIVKAFNIKTCEAIVISTLPPTTTTTTPAPTTTTTTPAPTTTTTPAPTTTTTPLPTTTTTTLPPTTTTTSTTTTTTPVPTTTAEIPQRDEASTVSFGYDLVSMGAYRAHMIQQFINYLLPYTGYGHFGVVSYAYCPENFNVPVTSLMDKKPSDIGSNVPSGNNKLPTLVDVVREMRKELNQRTIQNANKGLVGNQIAVLFVDPSATVITNDLMKETELLKQDGSKLFLINVGQGAWYQPQSLYSMSSQPYTHYMYNYPTYDQLLYSARHTPFQFRSMCNRYVPTY